MHQRKQHGTSSTTLKLIQEKHNALFDKSEDSILDFVLNHKFLIALSVRLCSGVITKTYFVPDEYWQSTEVAHKQIFGYGYITWEWREKIRSYLYPFIFEVYFTVVRELGLDTRWLVINGPHLIQAVLTAISDTCVYRFAFKIHGDKGTATYAFALNLLSWFLFYTGSRTLSNTVEMCFTSIGMSCFPFTTKENNKHCIGNSFSKDSLFYALVFGGMGCIVRPTCLLIWVPLVLFSLYYRFLPAVASFKTFVWAAPVLALLCLCADFYFYKALTIVHWNFVEFNIFQNIGVFYGAHPFSWYFFQGIPVVLAVHAVFVFAGAVQMGRRGLYPQGRILCWVGMVFILIHSLIPHKEFRFLLPLFPIFMCMAGRGFQTCSYYVNKKLMIVLLLGANVPAALYFCTIHQQGTIAVMDFLASSTNHNKKNDTILFLMPCHSTPFYSYMHKNIPMKFLTCEPDQSPGYLCESDLFFSRPQQWLNANVDMDEWSYVVMFDKLSPVLKEYLRNHGFKLIQSLFHSHFPEGHIGNNVEVYAK